MPGRDEGDRDRVPVPGFDAGWNDFFGQMNEQFMDAMERNVEAQAEFVEAFSETVGEAAVPEGEFDAGGDGADFEFAGAGSESMADAVGTDEFADGLDGYVQAYGVWMDAASEMVERADDALAGEDVDVEQFRDVWLSAANDAFKEVTSTTAFAAATGETVERALEARREADDLAEDTLHELGFATESDVCEVGDRLVELERRQHAVETKLDRLLEAVEGEGEVTPTPAAVGTDGGVGGDADDGETGTGDDPDAGGD